MSSSVFRCLLIIMVYWWIASPVQSQAIFKINQYNIVNGNDWMPVATLFTNYQFNDHWSATGYFYVNANPKGSWGEGLAGATYTPVKGISVGFLGGFQSNEIELWRISPIVMLNKGAFSFSGAFEFGGRRTRWDCMGFYTTGNLKLGGELIRYYDMYAAGPRAEFSFIRKQPVTLFYSGLISWTHHKYYHMFGIFSAFGR